MPKANGKWDKIIAARRLLELESSASLKEVREAYRRKAKQHHPDGNSIDGEPESPIAMHRLTEAYQIIIDYCQDYRIPLEPGEQSNDDDDEEWWMKRFGQDPLWGKNHE